MPVLAICLISIGHSSAATAPPRLKCATRSDPNKNVAMAAFATLEDLQVRSIGPLRKQSPPLGMSATGGEADPLLRVFVRLVRLQDVEQGGFLWIGRRYPAAAHRCEPELRGDAHHDLGLAIGNCHVGGLDRIDRKSVV